MKRSPQKAYHSTFNKRPGTKSIGGCAILPIHAKFSKGPAPRPSKPQCARVRACSVRSCAHTLVLTPPHNTHRTPGPEDDDNDIVAETLKFFKANVFFQNYEIKGDADRLLMYLTLYTHQCVCRITRVGGGKGRKGKGRGGKGRGGGGCCESAGPHRPHLLFLAGTQCNSKDSVLKEMYQLSIENFAVGVLCWSVCLFCVD